MNTVNGGVTTTDFKVIPGNNEIIIILKNKTLPGYAFNYSIEDDYLVVDTLYAFKHWQNDIKLSLGYPMFIKTFKLPDYIDRSRIDSMYKKGIFTLYLPFQNDTKAHEDLN